MLIEGFTAPGEFNEVGNFSHGSYSLDVGYRSRTNKAMAYLADWPAAMAHGDHDGWAHLVDLGAPAVTTPPAWDNAGLHKWHKAIFFGEEKRYSVMSGWSLGVGGWIYKAPQGDVWHLLASRPDAATLRVETKRLMHGTNQFSQVASVDISAFNYGSTFFVNFDPTGSGRAAIHCHAQTGALNSPWIEYVFEATVSGGDDGALPSVVLARTFNAADCVVTELVESSAPALRWDGLWNTQVLSEATTSFPSGTMNGVYEVEYLSPIYSDNVGVQTWRSNETRRALAVVYKKSGQRAVLGLRQASEFHHNDGYVTQVLSWSGTLKRVYDGSGNQPVESYLPAINWERRHRLLSKVELTLDGVKVAGFERREEVVTSYLDDISAANQVVGSSTTISGSGQQANGVWLQDEPSLTIDLLTPNSACLFKLVASNVNLFAWASADFAQTLSATAPDALDRKRFSFDPETGQYDRRIVQWF